MQNVVDTMASPSADLGVNNVSLDQGMTRPPTRANNTLDVFKVSALPSREVVQRHDLLVQKKQLLHEM